MLITNTVHQPSKFPKVLVKYFKVYFKVDISSKINYNSLSSLAIIDFSTTKMDTPSSDHTISTTLYSTKSNKNTIPTQDDDKDNKNGR